MNQLVIDIVEDRRTTKDGSPIAISHAPRHARLWLWLPEDESPRFVGELFVDEGELAKLLQAGPVIDFAAEAGGFQLEWRGLVPEVPPHPKMGRLMKVLKGFAKMFRD